MCFNTAYLKKNVFIGLAMWGGSITAQATVLNFSATIVTNTCSVSLDRSVISLNQVPVSHLQSGVLLNLQPFTLKAENCEGVDGGTQQVGILVSGAGAIQDGKWLFRSIDSDVGGAGVMLVQSANQPSFTDKEVMPGDMFPLANPGLAPSDKEFPFFAGISCGGSTGCATVKTGTLVAHITFLLAYR